jgi:hypothetical protein
MDIGLKTVKNGEKLKRVEVYAYRQGNFVVFHVFGY